MKKRSLSLLIIFLFVLCFPISSDSQKFNLSTSLLYQEQVHDVTIKDIKGEEEEDKSIDIFREGKGEEEEDKSIDIFREGKVAPGVTRGKGGGRKATPKRNAAVDHRPPLFFSTTSVLFTGFIIIMHTLTSFDVPLRLLCCT